MGVEVKNIFITGCNRPNGIGFLLVKEFLERANPTHLFATCRNIEKAEELAQLAKKHPNLHIMEFGELKGQGQNVRGNGFKISSFFSSSLQMSRIRTSTAPWRPR